MRFVFLLSVLLLAAVPAGAGEAAPKIGGTLVYATGTDAQTLDPQFVTDVPTARVVMQIHDTLVTKDAHGEIEPSLAESWSVSPDKLTWTMHLRSGVEFQDGTPFDAAAVKASFDRIMASATGSPRRSLTAAIAKVEVVDPHTVAFTTKAPYAPFLGQLSAYNLAILSPAALAKEGKSYSQHPVGTGPFKLASWQPGEKIVLARNEHYWGKKPPLDRIEIRIVPEDSARVLQLMSGEADLIASVPPIMLPRLKATKSISVIEAPSYRTIYIGLNAKVPPFDDLRVRQAVAHAIDSAAIVKGVLGGIGKVGGSFEAPVIPGAAQDLKPYAHDPALAKKLLAEAGHPEGFRTKLYVPTGRYLMDRQVGEAVQAQLREVGIDAAIEAPEWGAYQAILNKHDVAPMFLLGKGSPSGDLDLTLGLTIASSGKMNEYNYSDPTVDKMIAEQRGLIDRAERFRVLHDIQHRIYDAVPVVPLFYEEQIYAAKAGVHGVVIKPDESIDFAAAWKE